MELYYELLLLFINLLYVGIVNMDCKPTTIVLITIGFFFTRLHIHSELWLYASSKRVDDVMLYSNDRNLHYYIILTE